MSEMGTAGRAVRKPRLGSQRRVDAVGTVGRTGASVDLALVQFYLPAMSA